jgi:superfamily I DNA/RNA helicase
MIADDAACKDYFKEVFSHLDDPMYRLESCGVTASMLGMSSNQHRNYNSITPSIVANRFSRMYENYYNNYPACLQATVPSYANVPGETVRALFRGYDRFKREYNQMDFIDLLVWWVNHFDHVPHIEEMIIDEGQDCNGIQHYIISLYEQARTTITIVGDLAQSIYGFRGSRPELMEYMHAHISDLRTSHLTTNYRSTPPIVRLCNTVLSWIRPAECDSAPVQHNVAGFVVVADGHGQSHKRTDTAKAAQLYAPMISSQCASHETPRLYMFDHGDPRAPSEFVQVVQQRLRDHQHVAVLTRTNQKTLVSNAFCFCSKHCSFRW